MTFIANTKIEDKLICDIVYSTISRNETVSITATFSNGYIVFAFKNQNAMFVEVYKDGCDVTLSDYIDESVSFRYDERSIGLFLNAVIDARTEFEVGFAYARLIQRGWN